MKGESETVCRLGRAGLHFIFLTNLPDQNNQLRQGVFPVQPRRFEMETSTVFLVLAVTAAIVGVAASMGCVSFLLKRGVKINWILLKVMIIKYVHQYRIMTRQETGKVGPLFYIYVIAMNTALIAGVIGIMLQ